MKNDNLLDSRIDSGVIASPTFCCFSICDTCILNCQMCHKWKNDIYIKPGQNQMTLGEWKNCALSLKKIAPENFLINFGGGEVTMVPWLFKLVSFCHELGFKTNIATNAFLIDEKMAKEINDSALDYINISLDSLDEATHDYLRGVKGVYKRVMSVIDLMHKYAPNTKISICSIMMEPTLDGILNLVNWAQNNDKISLIYLMVLMQPNNTLPDAEWYKKEFEYLWPKDYKKAEKILDELIALKNKGYKICNPVGHIQAFKTYFRDPCRYVKKSACNIDRAVHISSVGGMFMCYRYERIGDVRETEIAELWLSNFAEKIRNKIEQCRENCHFLLNCNFEA